MKLLKKYFGRFMIRGLVAMGFGPVVLAIVYLILGLTGMVEDVSVYEITLGIFTITILAFLAGGITIVYQIEELPISKAITLHGAALYICYAATYFINGWLAEGLIPFIVFTVTFVVGYVLIWIIIYFATKKNTAKLNKSLKF